MKKYLPAPFALVLFSLLALLLSFPLHAKEMKWEKRGKEAVIVCKDGKEKKIVGSGYDSKFKSPGPYKNGFLWDDLYLANYTWARDADPSVKHPVHLVKIEMGDVVDCSFGGENAYDDVYYRFDDRRGDTGSIYFEVVRDGKHGIVALFGGQPKEIIPPSHSSFLPIRLIRYNYIRPFYYQKNNNYCLWGWIADLNGEPALYNHAGARLISSSPATTYSAQNFMGSGWKYKDESPLEFSDLDWKNNKYPVMGATPVYGALSTSPQYSGDGGMLFDNTGPQSSVPNYRQGVFFLHAPSCSHSLVCMAGERNAVVAIPHIKFFKEFRSEEQFPNFRFGENIDGSYMAIAPDNIGKNREKAGFVDFGDKLTYIPPVFDADWTDTSVRPERFRSLPCDTARVYTVSKDRANSPGMTHRLYSAGSGKFIWDTPRHAIVSQSGDREGFIDIARGCNQDSIVKGFITARADSVVMLSSVGDLARMGEDKDSVGDNRLFSLLGGVGLANEKAGRYIAPVYDNIMPLCNLNDSLPENWFGTARGHRVGLVVDGETVLDCIYHNITSEGDSTLVFTLYDWPRKARKMYYDDLTTSTSNFPYVVKIRTDSDTLLFSDNFDKILARLSEAETELGILNRYYSALDVADVAGRADMMPYLKHYGAVAMENLILKKLSADDFKPTAATQRGLQFARDLYAELDMPGDLERCEQLAENVREVQLQQELQRQQEQQRLEALRQQRAQAWADVARALGEMAQGINNAVSQYSASKRTSSSSYSRTRRSQPSTSTSARSSSSSHSTSTAKTKTPNFGNRKALELAYEQSKSTLMKYYYGSYVWDLREVRDIQQSMRETRAQAQKQGFTIYKSDLEDVSAPYRK